MKKGKVTDRDSSTSKNTSLMRQKSNSRLDQIIKKYSNKQIASKKSSDQGPTAR